MSPVVHDVDVLIVGGGGCGLAASVMLSDLGVDHVLVERHPGTALMPKANLINPRTMEILAAHGVAEDVYRQGAPIDQNRAVRFYTSLGGEEVWHRRELHREHAWSGGLPAHYRPLSAQRHASLPQKQFEPLLRDHAQARNPNRISFGHELVSFAQDSEGVTATIGDRATGATREIRARYLLAADGGKTIGPALGIAMEGPEPFVHTVSVHFAADLSPWLDNDDAILRTFVRPTLDATWMRTGCLAMGPTRYDRHSEEWVVTITLAPGEEDRPFDEELAAAGVRERLNLPELELTVIRFSRWRIEAVLAERYREGRIFLAGDAAHRHSPHGGLGLNTGIQDAHNLVWKLWAVLAGHADEQLLESYESERRPVGRRNIDFATTAFFGHLAVAGAFGVLAGAPAEHNRRALEALFSAGEDGRRRMARLQEMFATLRLEYGAADVELGFHYGDSPAVVPDGTEAPASDAFGHAHTQSARPGHRLPHAWLDRLGQQLSTHDLLRPGTFTLLAGADGNPWCEAAQELTLERGLPIEACCIGPGHALSDRDGVWLKLRGHGEGGAVLVRPDGHVAYRAAGHAEKPRAALEAALAVAL